MTEIHEKIDLLLRKIASKNEELQAKGSGINKLDSELLRLNCLELYDAIHELSLPREISFTRKPAAIAEPKAKPAEDIKPIVEEIKPEAEALIQEIIEPATIVSETKELLEIEEKPKPETPKAIVEQAKLPFDLFAEEEEPPMLETLHNLEEIANIDSEILEESEPISEPEVITEPVVIIEPEPIEEPEPEAVPEAKQIVIEPEPKKVIEVEEKSYDMPKFVPVAGPAPIKKPVPKSQNEEKSLLEKISANQTNTSLHDAISSKKEDLGDHNFSSFKISKITEAIDISKRFELQNNLFGGNSQHYAQSINLLELAKNKFDALEEFNRLAEQFHWDPQDELVQELKNYINRKF